MKYAGGCPVSFFGGDWRGCPGRGCLKGCPVRCLVGCPKGCLKGCSEGGLWCRYDNVCFAEKVTEVSSVCITTMLGNLFCVTDVTIQEWDQIVKVLH